MGESCAFHSSFMERMGMNPSPYMPFLLQYQGNIAGVATFIWLNVQSLMSLHQKNIDIMKVHGIVITNYKWQKYNPNPLHLPALMP